MGPYVTLFVLLALLAGLTVGKAWERYKLKDGRWMDRRRARESPHYMLGLNFLVANQIDPAIEELSTAAEAAGDPLEIHLILGNLYREKGQVGRAIQEHQALLQRPHLRKLEHANVLLCLEIHDGVLEVTWDESGFLPGGKASESAATLACDESSTALSIEHFRRRHSSSDKCFGCAMQSQQGDSVSSSRRAGLEPMIEHQAVWTD